jgi:membrane protein DedA with SNARE-associated domain
VAPGGAGLRALGKLAILSSRFLVTPLSLPINAIAGAVRYPFAGFLLLCAIGELAWVSLFGGLGYIFAGSWRAVGGIAGDLGLWLACASIAALGVYEAYKLWSHHNANAEL